jgi:hypothetical protein
LSRHPQQTLETALLFWSSAKGEDRPQSEDFSSQPAKGFLKANRGPMVSFFFLL